MSNRHRYHAIVGRVLVGGIGIVLMLAGVLKLLNVGAEDMLEGLAKANLLQHKTLISVTAIVCGGLLLLPRIRTLEAPVDHGPGGRLQKHRWHDDRVVVC